MRRELDRLRISFELAAADGYSQFIMFLLGRWTELGISWFHRIISGSGRREEQREVQSRDQEEARRFCIAIKQRGRTRKKSCTQGTAWWTQRQRQEPVRILPVC